MIYLWVSFFEEALGGKSRAGREIEALPALLILGFPGRNLIAAVPIYG